MAGCERGREGAPSVSLCDDRRGLLVELKLLDADPAEVRSKAKI